MTQGPPPAPRLWLHIGMQKTGTSAAQSWLAAHEAMLRGRGLLYVRPRPNLPACGALVNALATGAPAAAAMIAEIRAQLAQAGPYVTDVLVSSENFSLHPPGIAAPLLAAFAGSPVTVLVWLRRQDLFAEALTKQWIKWQGKAAEDPERLMRAHVGPLLDYDRLLADWARSFPQARLEPHLYAERLPGAPPPDSIAALLGAMGRADLIPPDSARHLENVSPRAQLVRHYQTLEDGRRVRKANRELMRREPDRFAGRGDLFTPAERQRILADHAASNARVRARWFPERAELFDPRDPVLAPQDGGPDASDEAALAAFRAIYDRR